MKRLVIVGAALGAAIVMAGAAGAQTANPPAANPFRMMSSAGFQTTQFGFSGTLPIVGDWDGDGRDDFGCYFPPSGNWCGSIP